ncbi:MAG: lipoprotein signal peptidase [Proteobacteria bacterium]|nr:lipoprotein signal peptidase [Pseudomonadota bacterium]
MLKNSRWFLLVLLLLVIDQATKLLMVKYLGYNEPVFVLPFLNFTLIYNTGAAFSLASHASGWQQWLFGGIALVVSMALMVWIYQLPAKAWKSGLCFSMILAGALGNLIDRVFHKHVIDFIQLHWEHYYFPVFNLADTWITLGAFILIISLVRK